MVLLICVLWVGSGFHAAQSVPLAEGGPYGSHFYMLFGMTRAAGPQEPGNAENVVTLACYAHMHVGLPNRGEERGVSGFSELQQAVCETSCHFLLPLKVAPVH